jgi:uncharacterized protein YlxP (DUF503 family)
VPIATLLLTLHLPSVNSLKAKRHVIKPLLTRLHKEFNISVAEVGMHDHWQNAQIQVVMVGNDPKILNACLGQICQFCRDNWPDVLIVDEKFELV